MQLIIKNVELVWDGKALLGEQDIFVDGGRFVAVSPSREESAQDAGTPPATMIDGRGKALLPSFKNGHTHAAMTLLRGYGDDMPLQEWLETKIWPTEAHLTGEDVYWGTRLAAIEMIRSGTTFANDMYFYPTEILRAFQDSGIKACVGMPLFDFDSRDSRVRMIRDAEDALDEAGALYGESRRLSTAIAPHSIYTCSKELLEWAREKARDRQLPLHIHLAETEHEVDQALERLSVRPAHYLDQLGVLGPATAAAHCVWLDESEIEVLADRGVTALYNPMSNMKLASGAMRFDELASAGVPMLLATDGVASNNNHDMFEEMRIGSLLQKLTTRTATAAPAERMLQLATGGMSRLFPHVSGMIAVGEPADCILVDLTQAQMVPNHNVVSNLVYAANGACVDTVVCDGHVLMREGEIDGEQEVLERGARAAKSLVERAASR